MLEEAKLSETSKVCFVDAFVYGSLRSMQSCALKSGVIYRLFAFFMLTFLRVGYEC